ncbi:bifunctional riboflavin kinase/FAD synthetase [Paenibacillus sp. NEAU-GSW1]|uniref:bifunctional riboflavin kinase/FAD synthetase n=1 Tax=Paenibacillus sp. NEAU-GSW1 TaxID=2682486 RepID=UPI0012E24ED5|nr:bifunctional riboflavin kinase/FAD synthetase [Paenibacillus sp. NEAU-GSW1]MUT66402.1 bifunctional riboflavin kinase/FAD synthetase [Paenibacillus sp. NEAU-GSW1]
METIYLQYPLTELPADKQGLSIAIGHFDGVHRGHQNVIAQAVSEAKRKGLKSAVMTFSPHPKEVLGQGDRYYSSLTPFDAKAAQFAELGVDIVFVMKFDPEFSAILPQQFVDEVLRKLNARHIVVGFDFHFGFKGQGNAEMMCQMCAPDINVDIIEPLYENDKKVSSTYIREALELGSIDVAAKLLGRPYELEGTVVHGDGRGRTIGFPTANIEMSERYVAPRLGVFAITAEVAGKSYYGVLNHGMKPTFNKEEIRPVMEAHLFDFHQSIYGESIRIRFHAFIRPEQKFGSVQELIAQIGNDAESVKRLFGIA